MPLRPARLRRVATLVLAGLVLALPGPALADEDPRSFAYDTIVMAWLKLSAVDSPQARAEHAAAWLHRFDRERWVPPAERVPGQWASRRAEAAADLKQALEEFDLSRPLRITTLAPIGAHDPGTGEFAFTPFDERTFFGADRGQSREIAAAQSSFPERFRIFLTNPDFLEGLPMARPDALHLLEMKRRPDGSIDRRLRLELACRLIGLSNYSDRDLTCEIQSVDIHAGPRIAPPLMRLD